MVASMSLTMRLICSKTIGVSVILCSLAARPFLQLRPTRTVPPENACREERRCELAQCEYRSAERELALSPGTSGWQMMDVVGRDEDVVITGAKHERPAHHNQEQQKRRADPGRPRQYDGDD